MTQKEYLCILSEQIRYKKVVPMVTKELISHIEEQKQDFMVAGMKEREAEESAVAEMGDPVTVGAILSQIHKPKTKWRIIILSGVMSVAYFSIQYYWLSCYFTYSAGH